MRTWLTVLVAGMIATQATARVSWETDFEKAKATAKATNRYMLLDFSGSDWCGWCVRLDKEVFGKREFEKYANENLVCVLLDFPRGKSLKRSLKEQNNALLKQFGVRGFPTVLILCPQGGLVKKTGYKDGGAELYVEHLKSIIDPHRTKNDVPPPTAIGSGRVRPSLQGLRRTSSPPPLVRDDSREMRTWTSRSGATITASALEEKGVNVVLKKEDGELLQIPRYRLSAADQAYLDEQRKAAVNQP